MSLTLSKRETLTSHSTQNLWCRNTYWQFIIESYGFNPFKETNGCHLIKCQHDSETCRGAHSIEAIRPLKHIVEYDRLDKSRIEWVKLFMGIKKILVEDSARLKDDGHKRLLSDIDSLNFIQAINLWRDMACIYRKLAKEILPKSENPVQTHSSGYLFNEEVPKFKLGPELEDIAWPFERLTRFCPIEQKMTRMIESRVKITIWDLCLATGINCKEGIHKPSEMICSEDFLFGRCSCKSVRDIEQEEVVLQEQLIELTQQITKLVESKASSDDSWAPVKSRSRHTRDPKIELIKQINIINKKISILQNSRPIHYTEQGMIPFEIQLNTYLQEMREKEIAAAAAAAAAQAAAGPAKKESWDHDLIESKSITKPVVKLTKLGRK